jgi:hypothetical protein
VKQSYDLGERKKKIAARLKKLVEKSRNEECSTKTKNEGKLRHLNNNRGTITIRGGIKAVSAGGTNDD